MTKLRYENNYQTCIAKKNQGIVAQTKPVTLESVGNTTGTCLHLKNDVELINIFTKEQLSFHQLEPDDNENDHIFPPSDLMPDENKADDLGDVMIQHHSLI